MRDPLSWAIPLFRAFGIQVRLHILYIIITLGMILREWSAPGGSERLAEYVLIWVLMLFAIILLHEFGHCFAARKVDGSAEEILMWPLGGLAFCECPHTPRANFITTAGGPLVNVAICLVAGGALMASGYYPPINVFQQRQLYHPELRNWHTGVSEAPFADSPYFIERATGKQFAARDHGTSGTGYVARNPETGKLVEVDRHVMAPYPTWILWTARLFWLSWMLFVFNLLPAFPLDGGRLFQAAVWARTGDYRVGTQLACWSGIMVSLVFLLLAFWWSDALLVGLGIFIMFSSYQQLILLEHRMEDGSSFGYDFSKGYGGFGPDDDTPPPKPKRVGPIKRWVQARRARKIQREAQQRAADEARLDEVLEKINRLGKESLSPDERRFMDRVSERYRNRQ